MTSVDITPIHRMETFKEWLTTPKLNESKEVQDATEKPTTPPPPHRKVYGFNDYNLLVEDVYCKLKFDHYDEILDLMLNELEQNAPGLNYKDVLAYAEKQTGIPNNDAVEKYLFSLGRRQLCGQKIRIDDMELDDDTLNNMPILRAAQNVFIYKMINEIKSRLRYANSKE